MDIRKDIEWMKSSKRVKLKTSWYFTHYAFVLLVMLPFILTLYSYVEYLFGYYEGVRTIDEMYTVTSIFLILGILVFIIQYRRLSFTVFSTRLYSEKILNICSETAKSNGWVVW